MNHILRITIILLAAVSTAHHAVAEVVAGDQEIMPNASRGSEGAYLYFRLAV
jgi:hypothetical protein